MALWKAGIATAACLCGLAPWLLVRAGDLTVASWGGTYELSQRKAYGEPWEARTGDRIDWISYNGGLGEIRAQVESGEVLWDVVDVFAADARAGCEEGLFEKLPAEMFRFPDLVVDRPNDCVAPNIIWSWLVFHEEGRFGNEAPSGIEDFFDLERFPGPRAISTFPQAVLEMALMADGVRRADVYDVLGAEGGVDRALAKLNTLKGQLVFWSGGAEPQELIDSGAAAMAIGYNGRVAEAILHEDKSYRIIWDGQVLEEEWFAVTRGAPNIEGALEFLRLAASPQAQAEQARWIPYGPMRRSALKIIAANEPWFRTGADVMRYMPDRAEVMDRTLVADPDWWADHGEAVGARYQQWLATQ